MAIIESNITSNIIYDYLIVGAGIAGLYTAYKLNKKYPNSKICILEASEYIGGRISTEKYDGLTFECGGARFNTEQKRIIKLIKELGLWDKVFPLNRNSVYNPISEKYDKSLETIFPTIDDFIKYMKSYIKKHNISKQILLNTTINDFADEHLSKEYPTIKEYIINIYPYYSELAVLNAVEGINLFSNELSKEMKYMSLSGGLQQITDALYNILNNSKNNSLINIYKKTPLTEIEYNEVDKLYNIHSGKDINININNIFITKNLILAIPKPSLLKIKYLTNNVSFYNNLNSIQCEPLYRIYARYPLDSKTNKVWFDGIIRTTTNLPIKYIIPINYEKGLIMISYTDSKFAKYWLNHVENGTFVKTLNKQLKKLFPNKEIPKAKWYKHCYWKMGAGYWKPKYNSNLIIPQIIHPIKDENIFVCGENYSSHQAWVEGSLETADLVLDILMNSSKIKKLKHITHKKHMTNITYKKTNNQKSIFTKKH